MLACCDVTDCNDGAKLFNFSLAPRVCACDGVHARLSSLIVSLLYLKNIIIQSLERRDPAGFALDAH